MVARRGDHVTQCYKPGWPFAGAGGPSARMSAPAPAAPGGRALHIRGTAYPVLLPSLRDPRLHLAAVIFSLHAVGQVAFHFRLSIVQIAIAIGTAAVLEVVITFFSKQVVMWPASAML